MSDDDDIFADLEPAEPVAVAAELVPTVNDLDVIEEQRLAKFKSIEDDILQKSAAIVIDTLAFRDVDPDTKEPPAEWVEQLGLEEAIKRLRVAKTAHLSKREAPVALDIAAKTLIGVMKTRAIERQAPKVLNMTLVNMQGSIPEYKEVKVD
jgi:hypothetical protein